MSTQRALYFCAARMTSAPQPGTFGVGAERGDKTGDLLESVLHAPFEIEMPFDVGRAERFR